MTIPALPRPVVTPAIAIAHHSQGVAAAWAELLRPARVMRWIGGAA